MDNTNKFDIVFNCSTNVVGGGIQNSVNFINHVFMNNGFNLQWYFLLSPQVFDQVRHLMQEGTFYVAYKSPASSLMTRREILKLVKRLMPKLVYTSAGPAYISFPVRHILGCSNPYILGASNYAYKLYGNYVEQFKRRLKTIYQRKEIKKADVWIVQTESSEKSLHMIVGASAPIHVIYNSVSEEFIEYLNTINIDAYEIESQDTGKKILVPTAYYKHKDLEKIPHVISLLQKKYGYEVDVIFTVQSQCDYESIVAIARKLNVESSFINIGAFQHKDALAIYKQYDVILQPSALEVFSTSYIEAMATLKPLVVPRFDFSESICGNYAYYYASDDINSYADALYAALEDIDIESRCVKAISIVSKYGSQERRVDKIMSLVKEYIA
ncbi:glycosyltransferase [Enterobacteriaceae bacterium RIT714]|nr:glycosyltransferase [Enterobacteriaceae bacterium RIT714]